MERSPCEYSGSLLSFSLLLANTDTRGLVEGWREDEITSTEAGGALVESCLRDSPPGRVSGRQGLDMDVACEIMRQMYAEAPEVTG
ncbi:hypothetical protein Ssi03_70050 [Sphaerisporangium siamense]|uniref:Uncharacterized protein n=1 Tax=Sphaerisporangium siamense TaxID=795645 RepID=A0A7W7DB56_9ACTN|nr:hypothetical protein [Sphaerisporangium siamense]MBB4702351.1 hypothetical protein [Sphaerisporangium siamense]GII89015.1 hypothetical protein Ssi03_70050 [Sphaerisporangium siamense]